MATDEHKPKPAEVKFASASLSIICAIGLTVCVVASFIYKAEVSIFLYGIFGGGILGADKVIKIAGTIFRIGPNGNTK